MVQQLNGSPIAAQALSYIARLYEIEREARTLDAEARRQHRQQHARAVADELHRWLTEQRSRLIADFPHQVGNTDGVPWDMRIAANRLNVAAAILAESGADPRPSDR